MCPNNGGSYSERLLRHLILFPPTSRSTSAVHRTPQKQSKKPARNSGLLSEGQHTFRIDAPRLLTAGDGLPPLRTPLQKNGTE